MNLMREVFDSARERIGPLNEVQIEGERVDPAAVELFSNRFGPLVERAERGVQPQPEQEDAAEQARTLQVTYFEAMRDALFEQRSIGAYSAEAFTNVQGFIDRMGPRGGS